MQSILDGQYRDNLIHNLYDITSIYVTTVFICLHTCENKVFEPHSKTDEQYFYDKINSMTVHKINNY